jgi:transposase
MIRAGFLSQVDRADLIALARDGSAEHRLARRANALVLLDAGWSFQKVADALLLDDGTIRAWHKMFVEDGLDGLARFEAGGSVCQMSGAQQDKLKSWVASALPRSTRQIGAWIEKEFGLVYAGRSGLIALLNRLGLEYHKPEIIPRKLDEGKQRAFIAAYENLLNSLGCNEAVLFADAVHPTHAARQGCSTLFTEAHGEDGFETAERRGIAVLGDRVGLIDAQDIVGEAAHSREDAGIFSDARRVFA